MNWCLVLKSREKEEHNLGEDVNMEEKGKAEETVCSQFLIRTTKFREITQAKLIQWDTHILIIRNRSTHL